MGKHKNAAQISIIIDFMENHPDLAKGFTKKDKPLVESLWQELVVSLNAAGPPTKNTIGWKKVWTEWKSEVKKKLAHNKNEARAIGGGPFSKHHLTSSDEAIVRICSIARSLEGTPGETLGLSECAEDDSDDEMPSVTSKKRCLTPHDEEPSVSTNKICLTPRSCDPPKKLKPEPISQRLKVFLDEDTKNKKDFTQKLDKLVTIQKENASSLRRIYRAIETSNDVVGKAVTELKNEFKSMSARMLTAMQEKNELKKQQLELDFAKFVFERQKK